MGLVTNVFALIGYVVVGAGVAAAAAGWIFKTFSEKWLQSRFDHKLSELQHEQQKELESARFEYGKLTDRALKLHQREFEVLPETWALLIEAYGRCKRLVAGLQQTPDVARMTPPQLSGYLTESGLSEWQKDELRQASDKVAYLRKALGGVRFDEAQEALRNFHNHQLKFRIFTTPAIDRQLEEIDQMLHGVMVEHGLSLDGTFAWSERSELKRLLAEGDDLIAKLEGAIRARIWTESGKS